MSSSVGIIMQPQDGHAGAESRPHADQALCEAKRIGKRRVRIASPR